MKVKSIPSTWLREDEHRFDCGPFVLGSIETRKILEHLLCKKDRLMDLTQGGMAGIYHVGQDKLRWVYAPEYGIPFLRSADILKADLSNQPLISREQVAKNKLFQCPTGTTLITRSGTIGRMAYCRKEMTEMAISQDVLKVVSNPTKVQSGYLYAFLSSRFGLPLVLGGSFGSIIVHIEAENIADVPVPRLGSEIEGQAHRLIENAATNRSLAVKLRLQAQKTYRQQFDFTDLNQESTSTAFGVFPVSSTQLRRLDATYFSPACVKAEAELGIAGRHASHLAGVARVFTPGIFKRHHVDDSNYGYAYYSGSELFQINPDPRGYLSRKAPGIEGYIVHRDWLLIQDAGQLDGLIGRVTRVPSHVDGGVVSNHLMRVVASGMPDAAYLFTILNSPHGYRAITRHAFGSSIPQLDPSHIGAIEIPWPDANIRLQIAQPIIESWALEDAASEFELKAITIVEQAIKGAA